MVRDWFRMPRTIFSRQSGSPNSQVSSTLSSHSEVLNSTFIVDRNRKRELEGIISLAKDTMKEKGQQKQELEAQDQGLREQKRELDDEEVSTCISG
jgi:hypothetical protein